MSALCYSAIIAPISFLLTKREKLRFIALEPVWDTKQILQLIGDCYFYLLLFLGCCKWHDTGKK